MAFQPTAGEREEKNHQFQADQFYSKPNAVTSNRGQHSSNNYHSGGSTVALQSATVKYRQLRKQQRQQHVRKSEPISETEREGIRANNVNDGNICHKLKANPSARTIHCFQSHPMMNPLQNQLVRNSNCRYQIDMIGLHLGYGGGETSDIKHEEFPNK